jgi:subtilase family serine protease
MTNAKTLQTAFSPSGEFLGYDVKPKDSADPSDPYAPRTNVVIRIPASGLGTVRPHTQQELRRNQEMAAYGIAPQDATNPLPGGAIRGETPATINRAAGMIASDPANPLNLPDLPTVTNQPFGGGTVIIVVDGNNVGVDLESNKGAGVNDVVKDAQIFSNWFGLVPITFANLTVVNVPGETPADNTSANNHLDWALESRIDVEGVHLANPKANIIVVQDAYGTPNGPWEAVDYAVVLGKQAIAAGQGPVAISMSWGAGPGSPASWQAGLLPHFANVEGIAFVGANGDTPGGNPGVPCGFSTVVCVGGSQFLRDSSTQAYLGQTVWHVSDYLGTTGGGNLGAAAPLFQQAALQSSNPLSAYRNTPDVTTIATTAWGVIDGGWGTFGGTSLSAPIMAGWIVAANVRSARTSFPERGIGAATVDAISPAGQFSGEAVLNKMYSVFNSTTDYLASFLPITTGTCGTQLVGTTTVPLNAGSGFQPCPGLGQPTGPGGLSVLPTRERGTVPRPRSR